MKRYCAFAFLGSVACSPALPELPDLSAARTLAQEVDSARLMPWVEQLANDHTDDERLPCSDFAAQDQYPACELSNSAARTLVREAFVSFGYQPETITRGDAPLVTDNLVAEVLGRERPEEVVLVAAHFDAFYAGADDNSSGVAVMLELARIAVEHHFARTVRFVGFDLEERGALGSTRYVEQGMADDVVVALILECVGYTDHHAGSQDSPPGFQLGDVGDTLALAANGDSLLFAQQMMAINHELGLSKLRAAVSGGNGAFFLTGALLRSDNGGFWLRGIPALMLTDTANYRNPNYHRPSDTPDTLDPAFMA
jgi:hypothetical protein